MPARGENSMALDIVEVAPLVDDTPDRLSKFPMLVIALTKFENGLAAPALLHLSRSMRSWKWISSRASARTSRASDPQAGQAPLPSGRFVGTRTTMLTMRVGSDRGRDRSARRLGFDGAGAAVEESRRRIVRVAVHPRTDGALRHVPVHLGRRIVLLTTFRKQRNNERTELVRPRKTAEDWARRYP